MKIDFYTKAVLTIIALSTSLLALKEIIPIANAQNRPSKVVICNEVGNKCVDVESLNSLDGIRNYLKVDRQ
jgi:hypothetical protein